MKPLLLLTAALLLTCCNKQQTTQIQEKPATGYTTPGTDYTDAEYTTWMSRAELQYLQEHNPPGQYFAHVQGRNNEGRLEYRAIISPFDSHRLDQWAVFWGIDETELFDWELRLLRTGFTRQNMQAFQDPSGKALYQIVWTKALDAPGQDTHTEPAYASAPPSAATPAIIDEPTLVQTEAAPVAIPVEEPEFTHPPTQEKFTTYTVQPGDTLGKIARRRGVTVGGIKATNKLKSDTLRIGQKLKISPSIN
jgi:LysM repeat protein